MSHPTSNERLSLVRVEPQPDFIDSSARWRWPLKPPHDNDGKCPAVLTASREWWEYAPAASKPHPDAIGIFLTWPYDAWYWVLSRDSSAPVAAPSGPPWEFDRYVGGRLKAEGIKINRALNFEQALAAAIELAGPHDVLVPRLSADETTPKPTSGPEVWLYNRRSDQYITLNGSDMVCEAHPDKEWPHDDCAGPGMPSFAVVVGSPDASPQGKPIDLLNELKKLMAGSSEETSALSDLEELQLANSAGQLLPEAKAPADALPNNIAVRCPVCHFSWVASRWGGKCPTCNSDLMPAQNGKGDG